MLPIGYLYKSVAQCPDWLDTEKVDDIYALCCCVSEDFADYTNYWRHNGFWLFDSPSIMEELANQHSIDLSTLYLFYYEAYEVQYNDETKLWEKFFPEYAFETNVQLPKYKRLEGFDVVNFSVGTSPECSPLSCNSIAKTIPTNRHCLFDTFEEAKHAIENRVFENAEPGPYRIIAVYTINQHHV
jgi:hypothetical protein